MKEEKMMILSMLEEGKITSEEAVKLMEALENIDTPTVETNKEDENHDCKEEKYFGGKFNSLEDIGADIGNALSNMIGGLRDIGGSFGFKSNYETIYDDLDLDLSHIENPNLNLKGINGSIILRPSNSDNISIKVVCQHKKGLIQPNEPYFDFHLDDDTVVFNPKYSSGLSIKLDVFLPEKEYGHILLSSTNGRIDVDKLKVNSLECTTSNAGINIMYVDSEEILLSTKNGRVESKYTNSNVFKAYTTNSSIILNYINSDDLNIKTANGKIDLTSIAGENLVSKTSNGSINAKTTSFHKVELTTSNGRITCEDFDVNKIKLIKLITSNGAIVSKVKDLEKEFSFDLETSMGNILLEVPDLVYTTNKQVNLGLKKIIAHTVNFNNDEDDLKLIASTSNGSIQII